VREGQCEPMRNKTIAWIDETPSSPEHVGEARGTLLIHFTDGSALKIEGYSHEEVDLGVEPLSSEEVRRRNAAVQGQREKARLGRLQRQEWLSVSCDERKRRRDARRAAQSPWALLMDVEAAMLDNIFASSRMLHGGGPRTVRLRCPRCGERQCENAPVKEYAEAPSLFGGLTVSIPIADA
jgi:hypothetical protein